MVAGSFSQNPSGPEIAPTSDFTVSNLLSVLPKQVFEKSDARAFLRLGLTLGFFGGSMALTYLVIQSSYLLFLPLCWFLSSLAYFSLFVIAHDCGHYAFFNTRILNTLFGGICFVPIFYPLEAWRLHHNQHHQDEKTPGHRGLQPQKSKSFLRLVNPLWWPYDVLALVLLYYDLSNFKASERKDASISVLFSYATVGLFIPLCMYLVGFHWINYWLMPWLLFHYWKNTLRQALPAVNYAYPSQRSSMFQTYQKDSSSPKSEVLNELVHYSFPSWFEFLCHNVNYQIPHYLSTDIPCYNLSLAHKYIANSRFHDKITQLSFGWGFFKKNIVNPSLPKPKPVDSKKQADPNYRRLPGPLWKRLNYIHIGLFTFTHLSALYALFFVPLTWKTFLFGVVWYYCTGIGITGGYHRLWAHRAYSASWIVRFVLMLFGSGAVEGSIRWWCRDHRVHHRYTDTDKDPYNAKRGFWYSHMGWMLVKEDSNKLGKVNIDDLESDPMIQLQHRFYPFFALSMAFLLPTLVAGMLWGDYVGGFFWAGIIRLCFVHHATFCVNSLAHYLGDDTFADTNTPRDSFITAVLTLGEGYHNFHHEFPKDYRNAIRFWQYDPTKWVIRFLAFFGLTWNLHVFPENEVKKGQLQMQQKKIDQMREYLDWGPEIANLPVVTMDDVAQRKQNTGESWIVIGNLVHDVSRWRTDHPGGHQFIDQWTGKDATDAFNGAVYNHSNAGRNVLMSMRVARIDIHPHHEHVELDDSKYQVQFSRTESLQQ